MRKEMEATALEISKNGITSAKDLATSYFYLASAGLTAEQSVAALGAVEKFAVAGAFDMAEATDLATDAQSALGLTVNDAQANLKNMVRVTDVLVGANALANASTRQFSLSLTNQAAPAMKAFNVPLEEGIAVLAAYADQGIKAEEAGNMFSRMLRLMENLTLGPGAAAYLTESMHGAGSPQAQRIMLARLADPEGKMRLARRLAGIKDRPTQ